MHFYPQTKQLLFLFNVDKSLRLLFKTLILETKNFILLSQVLNDTFIDKLTFKKSNITFIQTLRLKRNKYILLLTGI